MSMPEVVTRKGKPGSVIVPIRDYLELVERAEDMVDVTRLQKASRRSHSFRPLVTYLRK